MASVGLRTGRNVKHLPITESIRDWEQRTQDQKIGGGKVETAAMFDKNGNPIDAYLGDRHSVSFDSNKLKAPETEGATFTHFHPDKNFGGTLSLQDLKVMARSNWGELRAYTGQGKLYSIKAGQNADRKGLQKWINSNEKILQKNFNNSYTSALKNATTVLKTGPNKGKVKIASGVKTVTDPKTGKKRSVTTYKYVNPMTPAQAASYARAYSVGLFDRAYKKNLSKFGFTYVSTNAGKNAGRK